MGEDREGRRGGVERPWSPYALNRQAAARVLEAAAQEQAWMARAALAATAQAYASLYVGDQLTRIADLLEARS